MATESFPTMTETKEIDCWLCDGLGRFLEVDQVNEGNTKEQTCGICDGAKKIRVIVNGKD